MDDLDNNIFAIELYVRHFASYISTIFHDLKELSWTPRALSLILATLANERTTLLGRRQLRRLDELIGNEFMNLFKYRQRIGCKNLYCSITEVQHTEKIIHFISK